MHRWAKGDDPRCTGAAADCLAGPATTGRPTWRPRTASASPAIHEVCRAGGTASAPPEFALRLLREHAQTGDVQISLLWNSAADLDLACIDPLGEEVDCGRPSSSGGTVDVDMNGTIRISLPERL